MTDAIERAAEAIYNLFPYDEPRPTPEKPAWTPGGNSRKQDEARRYATAALAATPAVVRCDRCGSSGDVFMMCAGCQEPLKRAATPAVGGEALEPFKNELARQERVRSYRDGDCYLVDCRVTIGDLRRLVAAQPASPLRGRGTLETLIREYARDLRRNSSGGDDYPWEYARGTADYLEVLIGRAAPPEQPAADPVTSESGCDDNA